MENPRPRRLKARSVTTFLQKKATNHRKFVATKYSRCPPAGEATADAPAVVVADNQEVSHHKDTQNRTASAKHQTHHFRRKSLRQAPRRHMRPCPPHRNRRPPLSSTAFHGPVTPSSPRANWSRGPAQTGLPLPGTWSAALPPSSRPSSSSKSPHRLGR